MSPPVVRGLYALRRWVHLGCLGPSVYLLSIIYIYSSPKQVYSLQEWVGTGGTYRCAGTARDWYATAYLSVSCRKPIGMPGQSIL